MAAFRAALPLVAALTFGLAGCYTHSPYGSYGYGPWAPAYTTPGTMAPATIVSPGVESLGAPSSVPGGTYQAPIYQQPSSSRQGDFYTPDEQQDSRKLVPPYDDPNDPAASSSGTYGSGNVPFGQ